MARRSAREKLLDCAEQLFGEHGLDGTSLRAINAKAGLSPAALHYHFGAKKALTEAILERRMPELMERRRVLFDELGSDNGSASTRRVLDALIRPQVEWLATGEAGAGRYMRFVNRLHADGDLDSAFVIDRWPGGVDRIVPLLSQANPALPRPVIEHRLGLCIDVMLRSLAFPPAGLSIEDHVSSLLDFLSGAIEAAIHQAA